jgi:hypothetical protein
MSVFHNQVTEWKLVELDECGHQFVWDELSLQDGEQKVMCINRLCFDFYFFKLVLIC